MKTVVGRWLIAVGLFVVLGGLLGTPFIHPARAASDDAPSFASAPKAGADLVSAALEGWAADGSAIVVSTPEQLFCLQLDGASLPCLSIVIASSTVLEGESAARARLERTLGGVGWVMGRLQASPDERWLAVERAPAGAETLPWAELWLADAGGRASRLLARDGAYSPRWSPDGRTLAYLRAGSVWLLDLDTLAERSLALPPTAWLPRVAQINMAPSAIPPRRSASPIIPATPVAIVPPGRSMSSPSKSMCGASCPRRCQRCGQPPPCARRRSPRAPMPGIR